MPVNYLQLGKQINAMGAQAHERQSELLEKLTQCRALLDGHASDFIELQRKVEEAAAVNKGLRCAVPVSEPLNAHFPCALPASPCTILSADGSQINPDPHDTVYYGLVNVGIFRIQPGSGKTPGETITSSLLYGDDLYPNGQPPSEDLIALLRDVREREQLAEMAQTETAPVVTLTDGPLELYHEPRADELFKKEFQKYLNALDDLALKEILTAGYVSRPRADLVVNMLGLLVSDENSKVNARPFAGITDIGLFEEYLLPGERSAIFQLQSLSSKEYTGRKALHFFYLNVGTSAAAAYARVEIPRWVAEKPQSVALLQSVLVEQARQAGAAPYPYPLIRAHEIAVVKMDDRQQLTALIERELLSRGLPVNRKSEKQFQKGNAGRTRLTR